MKTKTWIFVVLTIVFQAATAQAAAPQPYSRTWNGTEFNVVMQAPHLEETPLQVFGVFEYKAGDSFTGADVEMDDGFKGLIQEMRKSHRFPAHLGETLLLKPNGNGVIPKRVLVMGLGDRDAWKSTDMEQIGATDIREACRIGLKEFSHASDVQDGGVHRESAGAVAEHVWTGMIREIKNQSDIASKGFAEKPCAIKKITYLAGPKFFQETTETLDRVMKQNGGK